MKVSDIHIEYAVKTIRVVEANYLNEYIITVNFSDGTSQSIDFEDFLKHSRHPEIRKYLDKKSFRSFSIVNGNLNWNDFDMIFPISDLYEGKIT